MGTYKGRPLNQTVERPELDRWRHERQTAQTADRGFRWFPGRGPGSFVAPASTPPSSDGVPWQALAAMAVFVAVLGVTTVAVRAMLGRAVDTPPVSVAPTPVAPASTAVVIREQVVVVVTATPAPVAVQPPAQFPPAGTRPQPAPVYVAPPPSRASGGYTSVQVMSPSTAGEGVQATGGTAGVGYYQCAQQGVSVTDMDRATNGVKMDGDRMYLSNGDGDWKTPPTYRVVTGCRQVR